MNIEFNNYQMDGTQEKDEKLWIPLHYWFTDKPRPNIRAIIESFPKYHKIIHQLLKLNEIKDIKELTRLRANIYQLRSYCLHKYFICIYYPKLKPFEEDIKLVNDRIEQLSRTNFYDSLVMTEEDIINGYKLYNINNGEVIMQEDELDKLYLLWKTTEKKELTFEEFYNMYDEIACTEWSNVNRNGKYVGDKIPKEIIYRDNGIALWKLPYPKHFIIKMVEEQCNYGEDSVRRINFLCEWIKRKICYIVFDQTFIGNTDQLPIQCTNFN